MRTLRGRVTAAATLAVALALAIAGIAIVATFASRERSSLDRDLERRAQGPLRRAGELAPPPRPGPPDGRRGQGGPGPPPLSLGTGSFVRVIDGGQVVAQAGDVPAGGFPLPDGLGYDTVEAGGQEWRTLTIPTEMESERRVQLAAELEPVDDRIAAVRSRVAVISGLGVVAAAVLAWWLAALALRPLAGLRAAVAGVTSTRDLSRRLPDGDDPEETRALAASVNEMLGRLERSAAETEDALEATRRFAADVGHELRTPLTSIRANFDTLARNPSMPAADRDSVLAELSGEQERVVALLDALQALARGDAGKALPMGDVDVAELLDAAVAEAARRHREADIELDAGEGGERVHGWPDGLRLLVDNLIENAVRHGGSTVRVELARDGADQVLLAVEDDGPGIPPEERDRIFDRFFRGARASAPGSGLGLAIVDQQARLHGGRVDVRGSSLGGARFEVRLPL